MQKVKLGTRVQNLGINRSEVADNVVARAVLIDPDPRVKYIGWDAVRKRAVEVDQDMIIKFGFKPMTRYYYLIARLNTDMMGKVVGDQFQVEYLQLSDSQNNDFALAINEMGNFKSLVLQKVKKMGPDNKDFSYLKVTPSNQDANPETIRAIETMRQQASAIDAMWKLIDASTSLSKVEYYRLLQEESKSNIAPTQEAISAPSAPVGYVEPPKAPAEIQGNDFGLGDDFEGM